MKKCSSWCSFWSRTWIRLSSNRRWEYGLRISIDAIIKTNSSSILSNDIGWDVEVTVKSIAVPSLGDTIQTYSDCPWYSYDLSIDTGISDIGTRSSSLCEILPPPSDHLLY